MGVEALKKIEKLKLKLIWKMKCVILHTCILLLVLFSLLYWLHLSSLLNFGVLCKCEVLEVESDNNWHAGRLSDTRGSLTHVLSLPPHSVLEDPSTRLSMTSVF